MAQERAQAWLFESGPRDAARSIVDAAAATGALRELGKRLPARLHLGTSSWTFPGWAGLVYDRAVTKEKLARSGLAAYAAHPLFRTVGLDRTFYKSMSREEMAELAALVPAGFRFLVKAHQSLTRPLGDERGRTFGDTAALASGGLANPLFLDVQYAIDRVVGPTVMGLKEACGPIVFQFPPLDLAALGGVEELRDRVEGFLSGLPRGPLYTVEVRNHAIASATHAAGWAAMLERCGALHGLVGHPSMPGISEQARLFDSPPRRALVIRWLLRPDRSYEEAKDRYEPFDKLVDEDPTARGQIVTLLKAAAVAERDVWVIANNKAEGSAPLSLGRLAEDLLRGRLPV